MQTTLAAPRAAPPSVVENRLARPALLPVGLGVAATLLSVLGSWIPSLWGDEAASIMSAERPLPSLFAMLTQVDAVHGTYYLFLHGWISVFGASPLSVRFPDSLAVGFATAAVVIMCRRLGGTPVAVTAGIVCAVLPRMTYTGEEARSYAFSAALAAWLTVVFLQLLRSGVRRRMFVVYAVLLAVSAYVFLFTVLIAVAHALLLVATGAGRDRLRRFGLSVAGAIVLAAPVLAMAMLERGQIAYLGRRNEVTPDSIFVSIWFGDLWFALLAWALIAVAMVFAVLQLVRSRPLSLEIVALVTFALPSLLLIGSSHVLATFTARYLTFCAPAAAILVACGIVRIAGVVRRPVARRALLVTVVAATVAVVTPVYLAQRTPFAKNHSDWAQISATMAVHAHPGDAVVFDESTRPSRRPRLAMRTYPTGFVGLYDVTLDRSFVDNPTWHDTPYTVDQAVALGRLRGIQHVWLVEYATGSTVDDWGLSSLQQARYSVIERYRGYRSEIIELAAHP